MTKLQRRLYMLFFMALFVVTAPVIVLFAQGYRFDHHGRIFIYSGSITVKSWPRSVDIYVNDKKQNRKKLNVINNSYTVNSVRPGKYTVRLEKPGYTSITKNIEVHSGISTELWNIVLFPTENQITKNFQTKDIKHFFLSPREKNEIVYFSKQNDKSIISILKADESANKEQIFETNQFEFVSSKQKENIEWSSDKKRILIPFQKDNEKIFMIAKAKKSELKNILNLNEIFLEELEQRKVQKRITSKKKQPRDILQAEEEYPEEAIEKVRWMFDKNNELVILTKSHELFYIDINEPEKMILLDDNVSGFDFSGNRIYYSQLPNNLIWEIKNNDKGTKKQITTSSIAPDPENKDFVNLIVYDQYRLAIITKQKKLYVYNNEKEKGEISMDMLLENVNDIQFSDDGKKLLYWSANEIWCFMLREWKVQPIRSKNDRIFITRFSQPIKNVQWMEDYENILFSVANAVKSASIDMRGDFHALNVIETESELEERDILYDKETQQLFMITSKNTEKDLRSSLLIDKTGIFGF